MISTVPEVTAEDFVTAIVAGLKRDSIELVAYNPVRWARSCAIAQEPLLSAVADGKLSCNFRIAPNPHTGDYEIIEDAVFKLRSENYIRLAGEKLELLLDPAATLSSSPLDSELVGKVVEAFKNSYWG
jgi:hypothetical protein